MIPINEVNREYAKERFNAFLSIFPIETIGFLNKVTNIYCLTYYLEEELVIAIVVRFSNKSYSILSNSTVIKRFNLFGNKNPVDEKFLFNQCFRTIMENILLDGVRQNVINRTVNSLTDNKIEEFKKEGIVIC